MKGQKLFLAIFTFILAVALIAGIWLSSEENLTLNMSDAESGLVEELNLKTDLFSELPETMEWTRGSDTIVNKVQVNINGQHLSDLASSFLNASSANIANEAIIQAEEDDLAVSSDWRMQLDVACNAEELEYLSKFAKLSQQFFVQKLYSYCDEYIPTIDYSQTMDIVEFDEKFLNLAKTSYKNTFSKNVFNLSSAQTDDFIVEWLRNASSPEAIKAATEYFLEYRNTTGQTLWEPEIKNVQVADEVTSNLQSISLELYSCQKFGGCGPDSLMLIRTCAFVVGCKPEWNYEQYVFANHSPIEMEYMQAILAHIYRN